MFLRSDAPDRLPGWRLTVLVARWQLVARMRRLRDDATLPNRVDQLVLADNPLAVANEVNEQIEHLRLAINNCAGTPLLPPRDLISKSAKRNFKAVCSLLRWILSRRQATPFQIDGGYRNGSPIPPAENLQAISKEIQARLQACHLFCC